MLETIRIAGRVYPKKSVMSNKLRRNSSTVFTMENLKFDVKVDPSIFSMQYLGR